MLSDETLMEIAKAHDVYVRDSGNGFHQPNGYLGKVLSSPVAASVISFTVGIIALGILCIFVLTANRKKGILIKDSFTSKPIWMWTGGILGALYFFANVYMSGKLGTGMTVIVLLLGTTAGGLIVDHFGLLESPVLLLYFRKDKPR